MARHVCEYCRQKDCNGRCRRSDLQREIRRLRDENAALVQGERAAEQELDRLARELRDTMVALAQASSGMEIRNGTSSVIAPGFVITV